MIITININNHNNDYNHRQPNHCHQHQIHLLQHQHEQFEHKHQHQHHHYHYQHKHEHHIIFIFSIALKSISKIIIFPFSTSHFYLTTRNQLYIIFLALPAIFGKNSLFNSIIIQILMPLYYTEYISGTHQTLTLVPPRLQTRVLNSLLGWVVLGPQHTLRHTSLPTLLLLLYNPQLSLGNPIQSLSQIV